MNIRISPITGGELRLCQERRKLTYRNEEYEYTALFYVCVDTGEQFTTTDLDTININQIYDQYRFKYGKLPNED